MPAMSAALRKLAAERGPVKLVGIDHLQEMKTIGRAENRHQEISEIAHGAKRMAKDFSTTVVLLSQLNRRCEEENRRPQLSDLKESGTVEESADVVVFVHRPERYQKFRDREDMKGVAEFILAKQRSGPTGLMKMVFLDQFQRFEMAAGAEGMTSAEEQW